MHNTSRFTRSGESKPEMTQFKPEVEVKQQKQYEYFHTSTQKAPKVNKFE